jgi:hypothetical protein
MSDDSLINDEHEHRMLMHDDASSSTTKLSMKSKRHSHGKFIGVSIVCAARTCLLIVVDIRSNNLDEHIRLVKQKKEEANVLRLQRIEEQLRKKEQKWYVMINNRRRRHHRST